MNLITAVYHLLSTFFLFLKATIVSVTIANIMEKIIPITIMLLLLGVAIYSVPSF